MSILHPAELAWTPTGEPYSQQFADIYFMPDQGIAESQHVFLQPNQLPQRFAQAPLDRAFVVAELGFGSGLNCLLTWQACAPAFTVRRPLVYLAIEKHPLRVNDLARILRLWPHLAPLSERLLAHYPPLIAGCHYLPLVPGQLIVQLWLGEASELFTQWETAEDIGVDSWFLDGFAPAKNPDLWTTTLYQQMARFSRPQARFSTFTAAGHVRRGLQAVGFNVEKIAGFGNKRDMLCGTWPATTAHPSTQAPWLTRPAAPRTQHRHAIIIGAGLAGCHCAYQLSQQGWASTVLEQADTAAAGASGNRQGIDYPLLNRAWSDIALQFSLHGFGLAQQIQHSLQHAGYHFAQASCGVLQLALDATDAQRLHHIADQLPLPPDFVRWLSAATIQAQWGLTVTHGGLFFSSAGWLSPPAYCAALLQAATQSTVVYGQQVAQLQRVNHEWYAVDANGHCLAHAPAVILANAHAATALLPHLPLIPLRGQVSYPPATPVSANLKIVLCHQGYVTPALEGVHCVGASYALNVTTTTVQAADNLDNAKRLAQLSASLAAELPVTAHTPARASIRCATPDHLPLIGAVPEYAHFMTTYADLAHGRSYRHYSPPQTSGLYLSVGHGSRGLLSTPLAAQIITAQLTQQPTVLPVKLLHAIAPQRFWVRQLKNSTAHQSSMPFSEA